MFSTIREKRKSQRGESNMKARFLDFSSFGFWTRSLLFSVDFGSGGVFLSVTLTIHRYIVDIN